MKAFKVGDRVVIFHGTVGGTIVAVETTATGEKAVRVAYETEHGMVAKLFRTRQVRNERRGG